MHVRVVSLRRKINILDKVLFASTAKKFIKMEYIMDMNDNDTTAFPSSRKTVPREIRPMQSNESGVMSIITLDDDVASKGCKSLQSPQTNLHENSLLKLLTAQGRRRGSSGKPALPSTLPMPQPRRKSSIIHIIDDPESSSLSSSSLSSPPSRKTEKLTREIFDSLPLFRRATVSSCECTSSMPPTMPVRKACLRDDGLLSPPLLFNKGGKRLSLPSIDLLFLPSPVDDSSSMPLTMPVRKASTENLFASTSAKKAHNKPLKMPTRKESLSPMIPLKKRFTT
jgi:hypothetical protein